MSNQEDQQSSDALPDRLANVLNRQRGVDDEPALRFRGRKVVEAAPDAFVEVAALVTDGVPFVAHGLAGETGFDGQVEEDRQVRDQAAGARSHAVRSDARSRPRP